MCCLQPKWAPLVFATLLLVGLSYTVFRPLHVHIGVPLSSSLQGAGPLPTDIQCTHGPITVHVYVLSLRKRPERVVNFYKWWNTAESGVRPQIFFGVDASKLKLNVHELKQTQFVAPDHTGLSKVEVLIGWAAAAMHRQFLDDSRSPGEHVGLFLHDDEVPRAEFRQSALWWQVFSNITCQLPPLSQWHSVLMGSFIYDRPKYYREKRATCTFPFNLSHVYPSNEQSLDSFRPNVTLPGDRATHPVFSPYSDSRLGSGHEPLRLCVNRREHRVHWRTWPWGDVAYVLTRHGARKLLQCNWPVKCVSDAAITDRDDCCPGLLNFLVLPDLFVDGGYKSDNQHAKDQRLKDVSHLHD